MLPHLRFILSLACLLTPALLFSQGQTVVDWGGDYVSSNQGLALPTPVDDTETGTRIWTFSEANPISPISGYTPPTGKSGTFYGGSWLRNSNETISGWSSSNVSIDGDHNRILYQRSSPGDPDWFGGVMTVFKKEDFLGGAGAAGMTVSFALIDDSPVGSLSLTSGRALNSTRRFVVQNESQWYVSQATNTNLSGQGLLDSLWGLWDPTGGPEGRLADLPVTFGVLGSEFTDIQSLGYFAEISRTEGAGGGVGSEIRYFSATAHVIPEPGQVALAVVVFAAAIVLRRLVRRV